MAIVVLALLFCGAAWLEWHELKMHQESTRTKWIVITLLLSGFIYNAAVHYLEYLPSPNSLIISLFEPIQQWLG